MTICFGICPNPDVQCPNSYLHFRNLDDAFTQWFSGACLPGNGDPRSAPRNPAIAAEARKAFHPFVSPSGFCIECGSALIFAPHMIALGGCRKCGREYDQPDLNASFCLRCGAPIVIDEAKRKAYALNIWISKLVSIIPKLQEFGYLPTSSGIRTSNGPE